MEGVGVPKASVFYASVTNLFQICIQVYDTSPAPGRLPMMENGGVGGRKENPHKYADHNIDDGDYNEHGQESGTFSSGVGGGSGQGEGENSPLKQPFSIPINDDTPARYLLYKPTLPQLLVFLASGYRELPPQGKALISVLLLVLIKYLYKKNRCPPSLHLRRRLIPSPSHARGHWLRPGRRPDGSAPRG